MPGQRSDNKVNMNAWISKEAREVLDVLAKKSHRSRTQVVELLVLAEAKRHAEATDDPTIREDLFRLIDSFAEQAE
jgi:predicted RNA polymerase sigma factor